MLAFAFAGVIAVVLCFYFTLPLVSAGDLIESLELECKINPNNATAESLARLPGIGPTRAQAIVTYRENFNKTENVTAFRNCDDLQNVKGIGPKIAAGMCPHLKFDDE